MRKPSSIWAICLFAALSTAGVAWGASPGDVPIPAAKKKPGKSPSKKAHKKKGPKKKGLKRHRHRNGKRKGKKPSEPSNPPSNPPPASNPPTKVDSGMQRAITGLHNVARTAVGVAPVDWSADIASYAQAWADQLAEDGCNLAHRPQPRPYGENLYMRQAQGSSATAEDIVGAWTAEAANYDASDGSCSGICGHYTQVVWGATTRIGCGRAVCGSKEIYVCNYDPQGNLAGQSPF